MTAEIWAVRFGTGSDELWHLNQQLTEGRCPQIHLSIDWVNMADLQLLSRLSPPQRLQDSVCPLTTLTPRLFAFFSSFPKTQAWMETRAVSDSGLMGALSRPVPGPLLWNLLTSHPSGGVLDRCRFRGHRFHSPHVRTFQVRVRLYATDDTWLGRSRTSNLGLCFLLDLCWISVAKRWRMNPPVNVINSLSSVITTQANVLTDR